MSQVVVERKAQVTRTHVQLVDRGKSSEWGDWRWETICVEHGGVCSHETRKLAEQWMAHPDEWCEDCMYGEGTLAGSQ